MISIMYAWSKRGLDFDLRSLGRAVLACVQKWTLKRALEFVKQVRPQASPNTGFMAHLLRLDQRLHGKKTVTLSVCSLVPRPRSESPRPCINHWHGGVLMLRFTFQLDDESPLKGSMSERV